MKFGTLFAYWTHEWRGDYIEYAKKVKELGFDILEIGAGNLLTLSAPELDELKAVARDLELTISSNIGPPKDKDVASKDPAVREAGITFLTDIMKAMDRIDSPVLVGVLYTYWPNQFDDLDKPAIWARGVASIKRLGRVAQDLDIDLCLEVVNRFETHILNTCAEAIQFCEEVDNPNVKILLDTFHMNIEEDNMPDTIRLAGDRLGHLHVGEGNRKLPGQGSLPWNALGRSLRDIGFDGGVVMEPFMKTGGQVGEDIKVWRDLSNGADEAAMDEMIRDSLVFLKKAFVG